MPVLLLEKDPFVELEQRLQEAPYGGANFNVRRPYGMKPKAPVFANISVYQDLGGSSTPQVLSILDSSAPAGYSDANHNFILQNVVENRQEKVQIVETFGDHFAFFYGQKAIVLQVSGVLFNSEDFNWKNEFLDNYEKRLRGTKAVENRSRVFLNWDDVVAQGYLLNVQIGYNSESPLMVPFGFNMLLSKPPLDLSLAGSALDAPDPGLTEPWTYRTFTAINTLAPGDDGVVDVTTAAMLPEYLTNLRKSDLVLLDPATGEAQVESGASGDVAAAADSPRSAYWVSGTDPGTQQWNEEGAALVLLNTLLAQQQSGVDRTTVQLAFKRDASQFQMTARTEATLRVASTLGTGITNAMAVVPDLPTLV